MIPIVTIREVVEYLHGKNRRRGVLDDDHRDAIETYLAARGGLNVTA